MTANTAHGLIQAKVLWILSFPIAYFKPHTVNRTPNTNAYFALLLHAQLHLYEVKVKALHFCKAQKFHFCTDVCMCVDTCLHTYTDFYSAFHLKYK